MGYIKEWISNLILDSLKDTALEKIKKAELNKRLTDFMNRQFKDFEGNGLDDEYDFQSLLDYLTESLRDEMQAYLFGQQEERAKAKEAILLKGTAYASAKESCPSENVEELLNTVLDIVYKFIEEQTELRDIFGIFCNLNQENLMINEEAVAGKRVRLRYIFLYKNEKDRILYLRAAALLKDEKRS